jgi:hypothetical protein
MPKDRFIVKRDQQLRVHPTTAASMTDTQRAKNAADQGKRDYELMHIETLLRHTNIRLLPNLTVLLSIFREWLLKNEASRLPETCGAKLRGWMRAFAIIDERNEQPKHDTTLKAVADARAYLLEGGRRKKAESKLLPWMNDTNLLPKRPPGRP